MRRLALTWGVYPVKAEVAGNTDEVIENSIETSKNAGYINNCLLYTSQTKENRRNSE